MEPILDHIEITVRDNGPGLTADVQQRLFESFFTTKPNGLGLGLPIVHSIIERHRGRVRAENAEEGGAIFHVTVPSPRSPRERTCGPRPKQLDAQTPVANEILR